MTEKIERRRAELLSGRKRQFTLWLTKEAIFAIDAMAENLDRSRSYIANQFIIDGLVTAESEMQHIDIIGTVAGDDSIITFNPDRCPQCGRGGGQCSH